MSLRLRLALWYGAFTGLLILLVCGYAYAVHSRTHYDELDTVLSSATEHVAEELAATRTRAEELEVLHASLLLGTGVRIYGPEGALLLQSRSAAPAPAIDPRAILSHPTRAPYPWVATLAPPMHESHPGGGAFGIARGAAGTRGAAGDGRWRVFVRPVGGGARYLAAFMPLDHIDRSVRRFGGLMLGMAAVGGVVTFLVGWLIAAHALRPVAVLTETAGGIARSREFSRRVPARDGAHGATRDGSPVASRDEIGRLATTFNGMLGSLEEAYAAQQRFVADASHELRAPLTAIQANLELLRARPAMAPEERAQAVAEAHGEAERLARLVADLLVLARADAGAAMRREPVELDRVLMEVLGQARHLARGQQLEVGTLEPTTIRGDPDRVKQLVLVLVDNAVKYTPAGGRVTVSLLRRDGGAALVVRDTGIGIPPEALPRVFERFYRADPARTRDPGGTGLGLPIAQWIARQHGGAVELQSRPGQGTTATVHLPLDA